MTPLIDDPEEIRRIVDATQVLLLDFDGPICSVFAGFPAPVVAQQLRDILSQSGHDIPDNVQKSADPFDVLFYAAKLGPDEARFLEAAFRAHEVEAIQSAESTPGAHGLMEAWKSRGKLLAIVSNNSRAAVESYLNVHNLRQVVELISARENEDISLLKPNPYLVSRAVRELDASPNSCSFVGDSLTDIEAAHAAGVKSIAFANKPGKSDKFAEMFPEAIVTAMTILEGAA